jgi:hypothetical protein
MESLGGCGGASIAKIRHNQFENVAAYVAATARCPHSQQQEIRILIVESTVYSLL